MFGLGPEEWGAVALTVKVAAFATALSLPLAIWVAHLLARKTFRGKLIVSAIVHLPLILPPVVTGYILLIAFGTQGIIGAALARFGLTLAFHWTGAVLAAGIMAFPLMVRAIRLGFEAVDTRLEEAATTLGASPWRVFRTITLPAARPAIIAGVVLAFAKAMGEFGATITFVAAIPGQTLTIPSAIYGALQIPDGEAQAIALVAISLSIALGAVFASEWLVRKMARV